MNDMLRLAPETESQRVFEAIRSLILQKQVAPGTPLSHSQLCRDLNTSRTPVREALSRLEGIGLVTTVPHRGTFVARLDLQDFLEITQIRMLLESWAAGQAAGHIAEAELARLEAELRAFSRERPSEADFDALHRIDAEIHTLVGKTAGNKRLADVCNTLRNQCEQFSHDSRVRFVTMVDELLALLAALRTGEAAVAEQVMRQHISNFGQALPSLMR